MAASWVKAFAKIYPQSLRSAHATRQHSATTCPDGTSRRNPQNSLREGFNRGPSDRPGGQECPPPHGPFRRNVNPENTSQESLQSARARASSRNSPAPQCHLSRGHVRFAAQEPVGAAGGNHLIRPIYRCPGEHGHARVVSEISHGAGFFRAYDRTAP